MYDRHLDTFIQVADSGSFLKASEKLFVSANAVTKQINLLESDLGIKLFCRSKQGLVLTEAGELIYAEAKKLIRHTNTVLKKAHDLENAQEYTVRVGVSLMNPAGILLDYWHRASALYTNLRLEVVPFEDTAPAFNEVLNRLGSDIDLIPCPYATNYWGDRYNSFHLCDLPVRVTCSQSHPLAQKSCLQMEDLYGQTLIFGKRSASEAANQVISFLEQNYPQIHIREVEMFDVSLFNQVVSTKDLIMSADCWKDVHPLLKTLPVDWDFTISYGLIYAKEPTKELLQFIMAIGNVL